MKINETRHTTQQKSGEKTFEYTLHKGEYPCSQKGCEKGFNIIGWQKKLNQNHNEFTTISRMIESLKG